MFTGIVQDVGAVRSIEPLGGDLRLAIAVRNLDLARQRVGDSISVGGVCLTVVVLDAQGFSADVSRETLRLTTLQNWQPGSRVNLEPALRVGDALGGHLVSGHVDGVADVRTRIAEARSERLRLGVPDALARYVARKGSVALDGVSLTVNDVGDDWFEVNLVPHTLSVTTLRDCQPGVRVNLEIDQMARYAERLLST